MRYPKTLLVLISFGALISLGFVLNDSQEEKLMQVAKEYKSYRVFKNFTTVVTDSARYKWTIFLCDQPANPGYHIKTDSLYLSKAPMEASPHGDKLYKLYIKDYSAYMDTSLKSQPLGQTLVKETWNVKEIEYDSLNSKHIPQIQSRNNGKWYTPTTVSELFIMYKETPSVTNDKGWVYGIVNVENKKKDPKILHNGKISTCISCHAGTKYDRIFGAK